MIGCLRTRVRKKPIIALYFESEIELKLYNLKAWSYSLTVWTEHVTCDEAPHILPRGVVPNISILLSVYSAHTS